MVRSLLTQRTQSGQRPQRTRDKFLRVLCFLCVLCVSIPPVHAQDSADLQLSVRRIFGYGGGDQIEGLFRMELIEPPALASVTFYVDDIEVATVSEAPFSVEFKTETYAFGWHDLHATGTTADGRTLVSNIRRFEFVSPAAGWETMQGMMGRIGLLAGGIIALVFVLQVMTMWRSGKKRVALGAVRQYGLKGGTICPKCHRPYSIHFFSFNAGLSSYYDRCDHCGKWSFVKRQSPEALAAAERAELEMAKPDVPIVQETAEEKLRQQIEDSRYIDKI
jgi:hypothetical protein